MITVRLLEFDVKTSNDRIYKKETVEPLLDKLNSQALYGELDHGDGPVLDFENASHIVRNIRISKNYLLGDIEILPTKNGELLRSDFENRIFRSRAIGSVDERQNVHLDCIYSFDAIEKEHDSFAMEPWSEFDEVIFNIEDELKK